MIAVHGEVDRVDSELVGTVGVLAVGTRGVAGPGEMLVRVRGGSEAFLAYSDEPIPKGAAVLVVEQRAGRGVFVVRFDAPPPTALPPA